MKLNKSLWLIIKSYILKLGSSEPEGLAVSQHTFFKIRTTVYDQETIF